MATCVALGSGSLQRLKELIWLGEMAKAGRQIRYVEARGPEHREYLAGRGCHTFWAAEWSSLASSYSGAVIRQMAEVDLLKGLPRSKRDIQKRADHKNPELIAEARKFGELYFDGPREYGYGGYRYDGRWLPVARDIAQHFGLRPGMRVLDVGCAKGFLVRDLIEAVPGLDVYGVDISAYAVRQCHPDVVGRIHVGSGDQLPFPDKSFDCVISINTIHNFDRVGAVKALGELARVAREPSRVYVVVDAYRTPEQKELFEMWVLTALYHDYPEGWYKVFSEAGYRGDWSWTVLE
jgi:SAM-dependent methyltransferase